MIICPLLGTIIRGYYYTYLIILNELYIIFVKVFPQQIFPCPSKAYMGIPGIFGRYFARDVRQAIFQGLPLLVSSISFDMNGVFHDARKQVFGEGISDPRILQAIANTSPEQLELEIQNAAAGIILRMVQAANPRDCLIMAVDGVAPGAKLQQQKGRRERAARERAPIETFDRNAITPGTEFMMRLDNFIVRFIGKYRDQLPPKVIYSSHLVPGEGEHKIMDYYRNGEVSDGQTAKEGGAHILYGLDADLIMLSLLAPINNIYLSRETVKETVKIDSVREYLTQLSNRPTAIDDFVVMMYLLGNDFLPHMPAFEEMADAISALLEIYVGGDYVLTRTNDDGRREINWDSMKEFITVVAQKENELLAALATKQVTYPSRFLQAALRDGNFYPNVFRSTWYRNALGPKGPEALTQTLTEIISRYVPADGEPITTLTEINPQRIVDMATDYMRTMSWTYLYYREGTDAINHDWSYPYYHSPMLTDLAAVMQLVSTQPEEQPEEKQITITGYEAYEGMLTFTALHQLVAVLPLKSRDLLPIELQPLFSYNSIIRDLLPDGFIVEMDGKTKYGSGPVPGVPIIPLIDRQRIFEAVAQVYFTPERAQLWMPTTTQIFTLTPEEEELAKRRQFERQRQAEFMAKQQRRGRGRGRGATQQPRTTTGPRSPVQGRTDIRRDTTRGVTRGTTRGVSRGTARGATRGTGVRGGEREIWRPVRQTPSVPIAQTQPVISPQVPTRPPVRSPGQGPTLVPIGTTAPTTLPFGRGPQASRTQAPVAVTPMTGSHVAPTRAPVQQAQRSPAQWKELPPLM